MTARDDKYLDDVRAEQMADAIRQEKFPAVCMLHPQPVFYDGHRCPCCKMLKENHFVLRVKRTIDRYGVARQ